MLRLLRLMRSLLALRLYWAVNGDSPSCSMRADSRFYAVPESKHKKSTTAGSGRAKFPG